MAFFVTTVSLPNAGPPLSGALFHCVRLSPITFIAVIAAWLRLA